MTGDQEPKAVLKRYLQAGRDALLWKLDGLSDYDVRRPMTPTGTNLLGVVKHLAYVEAGYFGATFDRPFPEPMPSWTDEDPNADMYAAEDETREDVLSLYRRVWAHADATIDALPLDTPGAVPWWREGHRETTLHTILVHVATETERHAGHADIVRELIDGSAGLLDGRTNLPDLDVEGWTAHCERLEQIARKSLTD